MIDLTTSLRQYFCHASNVVDAARFFCFAIEMLLCCRQPVVVLVSAFITWLFGFPLISHGFPLSLLRIQTMARFSATAMIGFSHACRRSCSDSVFCRYHDARCGAFCAGPVVAPFERKLYFISEVLFISHSCSGFVVRSQAESLLDGQLVWVA
ncbi:uncharacterized protein LOC131249512 [Magnolia sinica]|uniref:uncharacterized protein LOC131249512 n=1 Tax=Magnolia sinica TaxID=86752 RepID=UPI002659BA36|nr:uncharacterized protein LOC131249512 [Magnolia sinica]